MSSIDSFQMMDHVMTCLEDIVGITGANSFRNK